jgi:hypothetical protein
MILITVKKSLNTGLTAQIGISGQEGDEFLIVQFDAATGIDFEEGLIDLLLADAPEIEAQPAGLFLLHNCLTFLLLFKIMQGRSCGCKGTKRGNKKSPI